MTIPVVDPGPKLPVLIKSAARVMQIFDFFDDIKRPVKVIEVAQRLDLPQSSTSMLLKCLTELGYVEHDLSTRTFLPSPRIALLGTWLDKGPIRDGSLVRLMEELSEKTGETVILAVRSGMFAHYIRVIQSRRSVRFHVPHGSRRLAVWSAAGTALLVRESDENIRALCRRTNSEALKEEQTISPKRVLAHVNEVRSNGYFFSKGLVTPGTGSIAVPLPSGIDRKARPFAIAISGMLEDIESRERTLARMIQDAVSGNLTAMALEMSLES
jgi:DNA-binding IclR family transcriptional regulator